MARAGSWLSFSAGRISSSLMGREFLNCCARFSLMDLPLWRIGPPFLKHSICSIMKQAASILFSLEPLILMMHSRSFYCLSDKILIWAPPDL